MPTIIYNGNLLSSDLPCIKPNDRGFTLGHGLFETILSNKSAIPGLDYHWHRLETSTQLIDIPLPFCKKKLQQMITTLLDDNNLRDKIAAIRLSLTHGESSRGIYPLSNPLPNYVIAANEYFPLHQQNFSCRIVTIRKNEHSPCCRIKSLSYLDNILAKKEAVEHGYDEAILLNTAGNIADGGITNIFMVKDKKIYTPLLADGALPGVVRSILLQEFTHGFPLIEKTIKIDDLLSADEVFLTNGLMGVQIVSKINDVIFYENGVSRTMQKNLIEIKNFV
ncbi:MAG: aminotransferase class IV [Legionella sp.]|nr:aminotransferase class IV [Legionella sp.]